MIPAIHPTALIHPSVQVGENVYVGAYAVIEEEVELGAGTHVAAHAVVKRYTRIGAENRIYEHAVIGGDPQDFKFKSCRSAVVTGRGTVMREGVTVHRGSTPDSETRIGDGCFLMANCHVAHDCTIGDHVVIANGTLLGGVVSIGDRAFISGAVTIHQFCRVGTLALLAASARINQDCLPFIITDGVPGRARALNLVGLRRAGMKTSDLTELKSAFHALRSCESQPALLAALDQSSSAAVAELASFIRDSRRGYAHVER